MTKIEKLIRDIRDRHEVYKKIEHNRLKPRNTQEKETINELVTHYHGDPDQNAPPLFNKAGDELKE